MVDRFGPKIVMAVGISVMGGGFFLLSRIDSIVAFYFVFVLLISGGASFAGVPTLVTTAKWFVRKRGLAMGIALSGVGLGGLFLPALGWMMENYGWRMAANMAGGTILILGLPLALLMRHSPERHGMLPDGDQPAASKTDADGRQTNVSDHGPTSEIEVDYTIRQALATPVFWFLALAFGMRQLVVSAVALHQIPFLIDIGVSQQTAATLLGSLALVSIVGRLGFGWTADHFEKRKVMAFLLLQLSASCLILASATTLWHVILFLIVYSPAYGGGASLMFAIRGEYFGRASFGTISGLMDTFQMFGIVLGPVFAGTVYDMTGSYRIAFLVFAASAGIAAVMMFFLKRPKNVQMATQPV